MDCICRVFKHFLSERATGDKLREKLILNAERVLEAVPRLSVRRSNFFLGNRSFSRIGM